MKKNWIYKLRLSILLLILFHTSPLLLLSQQLAFPGAEGFGRFATGGRNGTVYHVTNLNDEGVGSFRDAVSQPDRIVIFDVGGVINITSRIVVYKNITIAGQTAPGDGITIYGNGIAFNDHSGNSIIRYIRFRMGAGGDSGKDAIGISDGQNYIFDHVSVSWGRDGTFDINGSAIDNITIQDCIIAQGVNVDNHSTGGLMQSGKLSLIRTLFIDNKTRNPKARGDHEYINNVVYDWGTHGYILGGSTSSTDVIARANITGNYMISGPATTGAAFTDGTSYFHAYVSDNFIDLNRDGILNGSLASAAQYAGITLETTPYAYPGVNTILSAEEACYYVMENAGASLVRDEVDEYLISELESLGAKGKIITNETENGIAGNVGIVKNGIAPPDSDRDGMPDEWEYYYGLNPYSSSDQNTDNDSDGYTNIEEYLNQSHPGNGSGILSDRQYFILARHSEKALDIKNGSTVEGTPVVQNTKQKTKSQVWNISNVEGNYYSIINDSSSLCIDVFDQSVGDSATIIQNAYTGNESQQWSIEFIGEGYYKIINRKSSKSLDVENASQDDGKQLIQNTFTDSLNQHFTILAPNLVYSYPVASIIAPSSGTIYTLGSDIQIEAYAEDYDGNISEVEFFKDGMKIGTDSVSPFTCVLEDASAGTWKITVKATDNDNLTFNSPGITIHVIDAGGSPCTIQENRTGFCSMNGTIDNDNAGFTDIGFVNTANAAGAGIDWKVNIPVSGTYTVTWRYANGSGNRAGKLMANNQEIIAVVDMPGTGSWTTWALKQVSADLPAGDIELRLEATSSDGLANIDFMEVSGNETLPVFCAPTVIRQVEKEGRLFKVYPNPFTDKIIIQSLSEGCSESEVQLFNSLGKPVFSDIMLNDMFIPDVNDIPPGFYYLRIADDHETITMKIIKN
ncbi:MAG: RICIN domain-containing protein [Bacteroidales bacterium]|nr:RICIN domain-containing protein [Bacteroidales bacterium]